MNINNITKLLEYIGFKKEDYTETNPYIFSYNNIYIVYIYIDVNRLTKSKQLISFYKGNYNTEFDNHKAFYNFLNIEFRIILRKYKIQNLLKCV